MYFDRARIKEAAKAALKRSHWMVVLAVLITYLLGGTIAGGWSTSGNFEINLPSGSQDTGTVDPDVDIWAPGADEDVWEDDPWTDEEEYTPSDIWKELAAEWNAIMEAFSAQMGVDLRTGMSVFFGTLFAIMAFVFITVLALSIFVGNVMTVGGHGWLLRYWRGETPTIGEVFASFRIYKPSVLTMLLKNLYVFLWSLLFVIPGIIKSYAYSMVPYIIYENPNLTANQAIKMSKKMTDGYKGDLFVFYLSYFGWNLLSVITAGIVGILYVNPYIGVAHAGVYEDLKWRAIQSGRLTWEDFGQLPPSDPWTNPPMPYPPDDGGQPNGAPANTYGAPYTPAVNTYTPPNTPYIPPNTPYAPPAQPQTPPTPQWSDPGTPQE